MAKTNCTARMRFADVTAIDDETLSSTYNQNIGSFDMFKEEDCVSIPAWGTTEQNQFVLDGSVPVMPDTPDSVAFWSAGRSGSDCSFEDSPKITVTFSKNHSSAGVTLYFADDYPAELMVTWYGLGGEKIISKTFYPDSLLYFCKNQVENYAKVTFEFTKTRLPDRYVKLQYILYGLYLEWTGELIMSASVHEEVNVISDTLAINTSEVTVHDERYDFDIANPDGSWKSVQRDQPFWLTETKDGKEIQMGTYFVDTQSFSDNVASFSLVDSIGKMDRISFRDGQVYSGVKAGIIIESIFAAAGIDKYQIEDDVYNIPVYGHLAIQTCREALQMVCFAVGAVADDSRSDTVMVYKPTRYVRSEVGPDRKIQGQASIELDNYVSAVTIESAVYTLQKSAENLYDDDLAAGISTIDFSDPCDPTSIEISDGKLIEAKTNYVVVSMDSAGKCTITGKRYAKSTFKRSISDDISGGEVEQTQEYGLITLYSPEIISSRLSSLLSYLKLRKKLSMQYFVGTEQSGYWLNIVDTKNRTSTTLLESQDIDLTGGYIGKASCRGYAIVVSAPYFTGTELYAGGDFIL